MWEHAVDIVVGAVSGGGIGAVSAVLVAKHRGKARERAADAQVQVAEIQADSTEAGRVWKRLEAVEAKVEECEAERDRDRDECARRDRDLRQTIAELQAHIERSYVPVDRFERKVARVVAKTQSHPEMLAYREDDSQQFLVDRVERREEDTKRSKLLRPPPIKRGDRG